MLIARAVLIFCIAYNSACWGADQLTLTPPDFLIGPSIARTADGTTYSYRARDLKVKVNLQITIVNIPESLTTPTAKTCAAAFLHELKKRGELFVADNVRALTVGALSLDSWRWSQTTTPTGGLTGVIGCVPYQQKFIAVTFEDSLTNASETFPLIRASLSALQLPL